MRFLVWTGLEEWLTEAASIELGAGTLHATGTQLGADPTPFRVDYRLECADAFITRELEVVATADGWRRELLLRHDGAGGWHAQVADDGDVPDGPWRGELPDLSAALDIDIESSPLTNTMPILRHGFARGGSGDFLMAYVRTPSLRVEASPQRYEHVRAADERSVVRYRSLDGEFTAELELDRDGLLLHYPRLARRLE